MTATSSREPSKSQGDASARKLALELLLESAAPELQPLVRRCESLAEAFREVLELLRHPVRLPCDPAEAVSLGERALELEELEEAIRKQWPRRLERHAVHRTLLLCGLDTPQALLRAVSTPGPSGDCVLNKLLEEAGSRRLRPETTARLTQDLEARLRSRIEVVEAGSRPTLVTAPHNIFLQRDGQSAHLMEEYTTLVAQKIARQLGGACLAWSRSEQRRSELLWHFAQCSNEGADPSTFLDPRNRDPNYLAKEEVLQNPWFRQMLSFAEGKRDGCSQPTPMLHIDVHGCRDPPLTPSHLTVGIAAMRHEVDCGRGPLTMARVEAFGAALEGKLTAALSGLILRPKAEPLVRVLLPALCQDPEEVRLSGAWALSEGRVTQSQQAVAYAGFSHSCQLEMSKSLRQALIKDEVAISRLGQALSAAWLLAASPGLPVLRPGPRPVDDGNGGSADSRVERRRQRSVGSSHGGSAARQGKACQVRRTAVARA